MNYSMFTIGRNSSGSLIARILLPDQPTPIESPAMEDVRELTAYVKQRYGEDAQCVRARQFQEEVQRRQMHTPEMIALLHQYGERLEQDLSEFLVYGSAHRPMSAAWARIDNAIYMSSDWSRTGYHTSIAVPDRLSQEIIERYQLSFVSRPMDPADTRLTHDPT